MVFFYSANSLKLIDIFTVGTWYQYHAVSHFACMRACVGGFDIIITTAYIVSIVRIIWASNST